MEDVGRRTFRIDSCLGRGGFGEVYRAVMSSPGGLQSEVAVKVLRGDLDPAGQAVQRLRDEGRLLARLDHPTILRVHDLVLLDGRISLVTEFIDGQDLGELCHGDDAIPVRALLEVIGSVAGALHAAWSSPLGPDGRTLQIVHRDIKPSNIRVSRHGQVKLLDFGIARTDAVDREARTQTNLMVGSPAYMAPERFTSDEVLPASDVFALGCALYEGLAGGDRLLGDLTLPMLSGLALDEERYAAHLRRKLAPVTGHAPEPVVHLLVAMLAHDPAARPGEADIQHRCEELAEEAPGRSLARYCRERGWPKSSVEAGELDGKLISEGTLARSRVIAPVEEPDLITERGVASLPPGPALPPPARGRGTALALVGGGLVVALIGVVAVGGGAAGLWAYGVFGGGAPVEDPADGPVEELAAPTLNEAVGEPAPGLPEPAPDLPAPAPGLPERAVEPAPIGGVRPAAPDPAPIAVAPVPTVQPPRPLVVPLPTTPASGAGPTGHVAIDGGVPVSLRREGGEIPLPADVPVGTWEIFAQFNGRDWWPVGAIDVGAGSSWMIKCSSAMLHCAPPKEE